MSGLLWKLNRLRAMGAQEIAYRLHHALQALWERAGLGLARPGKPREAFGRIWLAASEGGFDVAVYRAAADKVLAGRFDVFAMEDAALGFPPNWNRDPKTGTQAPLQFGKTLNYRDERLVGDIKYLWEPSRHLELVTLAQAWHVSGEERYAEGCRRLLTSWFEQCPYPLGPHWTSSLEHAVRLLNWAVAWQLLGGADAPIFQGEAGQSFRRRWLDAIFQHCHFIAGHFSKFSSANNHLLGEYAGLFMGALMWPCWPESARWLETARRGLADEGLKQNAPDGVNREQAIWYHHEVADMMLLCGLAGRAHGVEFTSAWWQRLEKMLEFVAALMDVSGRLPMIGDADDAVMVRFSREAGFNVYRSLLATGAVLFERGDFARGAGRFDDKSRWLLGEDGERAFARLAARPSGGGPLPRAFPEGGYYILGADFDTPQEVRIVADAGPLGYLSIAAHGHADALAFTLSAGGDEILIDPGTYAYHTQKKWRDYFRGTSAHNTVRVDGVDQSIIGGNFLWLKHARAWCEQWQSDAGHDRLVAAHDGYLRLPDPVLHRRTLEFDKAARTLRVTDTLECKGPHAVEIFWHFDEGCVVQVAGRMVSACCGSGRVRLTMPEVDWEPRLALGQEEPPQGWVSQHFDRKTAAPCVVWSGSISGTTTLDTLIALEPRNAQG